MEGKGKIYLHITGSLYFNVKTVLGQLFTQKGFGQLDKAITTISHCFMVKWLTTLGKAWFSRN